jgi:glycosyltransferase involved in cell wall biosynthesis
MQPLTSKKRILIFIVAYNAERTVQEVLQRIPRSLTKFQTEILIIDDSSQDTTFERAHEFSKTGQSPFPITVLYNPVNQGYGGNQKVGFQYAILNDFDFVALVHGDGQYAPECLPELLEPLIVHEADAVFGSRMMSGRTALKGGMPMYKYIGNKILTTIQNRLLATSLSEFHSGYRLYSVNALRCLPFDRNTNDFHFDTEIIIQFLRAGLKIKELPIPTYYGDEICRVNGIKYALQVVRTTLLSRIQDFGIWYDRKFDVEVSSREKNALYQSKLSFQSPHALALARIPSGARVADIGCGSGHVSNALKRKGCRVTSVDRFPIKYDFELDRFVQADLDKAGFPLDVNAFDYVLLLDVLEHLRSPERFLEVLRRSRTTGQEVKLIVSTANIGFFVTRLALLFGWFNYGLRGILDLTHTRLFTFRTVKHLLEQAGYEIEEVRGVPAPFPLVFGDSLLSKIALAANQVLIGISRPLFSYQIFMVCSPSPSLPWLLARAQTVANIKIENAYGKEALSSS